MTPHELLQLPETLLWAWRKVRRCYQIADSLYDQAELAAFDLNLEAELESIRQDFAAARWRGRPLRLIPQPKKPDKLGNPRLRQYFELAVRDQVAWAAVATVLGPELDRKMPAWSYGNRLYRAAWYEDEAAEQGSPQLNIGPYRHASGHLYRHFKHSWPLYRRHLSLTARRMVAAPIDLTELDHGERRALDQAEGLVYLDAQHWTREAPPGDTLYAASLDLKKFYPSVRVEAILRGFASHVQGFATDPALTSLVTQMLRFEVDDNGLNAEMRAAVEPPVSAGHYNGIPTGLFVGGFLANVAMLSLDLKVDTLLRENRGIAHFRFVDDHAVLAYDFEELCNWISDFAGLLEAFDIGAAIEPDKYVPPELKYILDPETLKDEEDTERPLERGEALISRAAKAAAINGRKPTELMTRTLAQVSMLAATDFDLLTDAGRSQRLEQLEWLLLANIPEQEIRGDTRMAFAAARIALLTPALFRPDEQLLDAHRTMQSYKAKKQLSETETEIVAGLQQTIVDLENSERADWEALLKRHFGLLFEAFTAHPDKARLFIRLIDFCRATGHEGFGRLSVWMGEHANGQYSLLQTYLGTLALQRLARHILSASADLTRSHLLHRERSAAFNFIDNLLRADLDRFLPVGLADAPLQRFERDARNALVAALVLGAFEVETPHPGLAAAMRKRASSILSSTPDPSTLALVTNHSIGTWYHWLLSSTRAHRDAPPPYWQQIADAHRENDLHDTISLRRYPALLPDYVWTAMNSDTTRLALDDAGWLLEAARANPISFQRLDTTLPVVAVVEARLAVPETGMTLFEWVETVRDLHASDPRRSEWTALEIVRQVVDHFLKPDSADLFAIPELDALDRLHPESIIISPAWRDVPDHVKINGNMTWEGWRKVTREHPVRLIETGLEDYRYRENLKEKDRQWPRRLRPIGQLLWGLLRCSFQLPTAWNIRGQERGLIEIVAGDLERLPISSFTLSLLRACLLPRSVETSFLIDFPALFGNEAGLASDDTQFDRPIKSPEALAALLGHAQAVLVKSQMTVLEYRPRQLIPVRLEDITKMDDGIDPKIEELL